MFQDNLSDPSSRVKCPRIKGKEWMEIGLQRLQGWQIE
jgi:hypothetical protein